jgi:hypothetical protein
VDTVALTRARSPKDRLSLAVNFASAVRILDDRVDPAEVASIVVDAAGARNGWKVVLDTCVVSDQSSHQGLAGPCLVPIFITFVV